MEDLYVPMVQTQADEVFDALRTRMSEADIARIKDAYAFARQAHAGQRRKTGEPYITHPIAVARIAAVELKLEANIVIACLLHDVVEDTSVTIDDLVRRFGPDVATLVRVVTKPKKEKYEMGKQADNFKQMLTAMRGDIRGILIKLSDRLHNMRTLGSMRTDKQMKIAGETDFFYAPLANRLGFYDVKTELENLSFRYRQPHEYDAFFRRLEEEKERETPRIEHFVHEIEEILNRGGVKSDVEVEWRAPYSLWRRMKKHGTDFHHLDFKHFIQITFEEQEGATEKQTALRIYSLLTDIFKEKPGSIVNYIDSPKENGYESFHVKLLSHAGLWEEVHISSRRMRDASHLGLNAAGAAESVKGWLAKFRTQLTEITNRGEGDFIDNVVTAFYNDDIMVFTPQGKPMIMPQKSTALDFAFEVHSKIGEFARYARINGRLCSVQTRLKRGDVVEIFTGEDAHPRPEWLETAVTYKAKRFLRSYIAKTPQPPFSLCPKCHPLPGEEVIGFASGPRREIEIHKRDCPLAINTASVKGDSIVPVHFHENPEILYPAKLRILGVDRVHMLSDLIECISEKMRLGIKGIETDTCDNLFEVIISLSVHSFLELQRIISEIYRIPGVDQVSRLDTGQA